MGCRLPITLNQIRMAPHKKKTLRRWSVRILIFITLVPLGMMILIRSAGWMSMRKSDREIRSFLVAHHVESRLDTISCRNTPVVYLKTWKGKGKKDAFIFVHGSPGSMDAFLDYTVDSSLLAYADLVTYDRPGFGNSDFGTSWPSLPLQAEALKALMDTLGYQRYWLAGHSYGAPVIVETVMRFPSRVAGISLIAGSVDPAQEPRAVWRKWLDLPLVRGLLPVAMRVSNEELMPLRNDLLMIEDDWDRITVPVSLIHGTSDVLVPFANMAFAKEKLTNADTILTKTFEGQSHFILWTHKNEIVQELIALVKVSER